MMSIFRLLDLPEEIARMIFEMVVEEGASLRASWNYALVSREVKSWVERVLYRQIGLSTSAPQERLLRTIDHHPTKRADFFAVHVKRLYLRYVGTGYSYKIDTVEAIVQACAGVATLALGLAADKGDSKESIARLTKILGESKAPEIRVTVLLSFFPGETTSLAHSIFRNVTHLELIWDIHSYERLPAEGGRRSPSPPEDWKPPYQWSWAPLSDLPRLTHFSLNLRFCPDVKPVEHIMKNLGGSFPSWFRIFMVYMRWPRLNAGHLERYVEAFTESDMRVVVSLYYKGSIGRGWLERNTALRIPGNNAETQEYWRNAEDLIEKRRQGLVEWPPRWTEAES